MASSESAVRASAWRGRRCGGGDVMAGCCRGSVRAAELVVVLVVEFVALGAAELEPVADGHLVPRAELDARRQHLELRGAAGHAGEQYVVAQIVRLLQVLHGPGRAVVGEQLSLVRAGILGLGHLGQVKGGHQARQIGQPLPRRGDEPEGQAADAGVRLQRRDRPVEPARPELKRVVHAHQVVARNEVVGTVEATVVAMVVAGLELKAADTAAQVLPRQVGGDLFGTVVGEHDEVLGVRDGVADAAQDGAQSRHAVAGEDDDAGAAHAASAPRSARIRAITRLAAAATGDDSSSPNVSTSTASTAYTTTSRGMS